MTRIQSIEQNPMSAAHAAPRCQHIRHNGQRCGAPALRGQTHCHFHYRIQGQALDAEDNQPYLPFIEDASSLQFALMRVMRLVQSGLAEHKVCALLLYALQIAASNLKAFREEAEETRRKIDEAEERKRPSEDAGEAGLLPEYLAGPGGRDIRPLPPARKHIGLMRGKIRERNRAYLESK